jgi:formylglycine-generating enzyme required for sulfatase activity
VNPAVAPQCLGHLQSSADLAAGRTAAATVVPPPHPWRRPPCEPSGGKPLHHLRLFLLVLVALGTTATSLARPTASGAQTSDATGTWPVLEHMRPTSPGSGANDAALIVAIEDYVHLDRLEGAHRNGLAWRKWLRGRGSRVLMLQGAQASSKPAVARALTAAIGDVKEGGTLWVIYIAHGLPGEVVDAQAKDGLLATYETNGRTHEEAQMTSVSRNWLFQQIDAASNVSRAVVLLDTCFSGVGSGGKSFSGRAGTVVQVPVAVQPKRVVLTAGRHDQYALPLPCHRERRPAFSYLALGALRGWADGARDNVRDGTVTAYELLTYVSETLQTVDPGGRQQTPELVAAQAQQNLAQGREAAPDLSRLQCHEYDPAPSVVLPAGTFWMGCSPGDSQCDSSESPPHQVTLSRPFAIDLSEVTVAAYKQCVRAGRCAVPENGGKWDNWEKPGREDHPVNGVSWADAKAYCGWAGKRLPSEAEWEYATRSAGARSGRFPWGSGAATCDRAVFSTGTNDGCGRDSTWPVCSRPGGHTAQGLCDMAGNVWEWVADGFASYGSEAAHDPVVADGEERVVRGGSWYNDSWNLRLSYRVHLDPSLRSSHVGFRCARTL